MKWRVLVVLGVLACGPAPVSHPDAGTDAGPQTDAGLATDAGVDAGGIDAGEDAGIDAGEDAGTDAGLDAGEDGGMVLDAGIDGGVVTQLDCHSGVSALTVQIATNSKSVMTAIATVAWPSSAITEVAVGFQTTTGPMQQTPFRSTAGATSPMTMPVLMLQPNTAYELYALAQDANGDSFTSCGVDFTTGALPAGANFEQYTATGTASAGYTLVAVLPDGTPSPDYVSIVDGTGAMVWYYAATPALQGDWQQQPDGTFTLGLEDSSSSVPGLDETLTKYRQIDVLGNTLHTWQAWPFNDSVTGQTNVPVPATDDHELRIQPNGDALVFGFVTQTMNLSGLTLDGTPSSSSTQQTGLANTKVVEAVMERVTTSDDVTFAWNAFDYTSPQNIDPVSTWLNTSTLDASHANAIDVMDDGNYLVSLRNMSDAIKVDSTTGDVIWVLGRNSGTSPCVGLDCFQHFDFMNDPLGGFSCQHGVRELQASTSSCVTTCPNAAATCANKCGDIIMFDDGNGHSPNQSRAVEYSLDTTNWTATLVWSSEDDPAQFSFILGYAQRLDNGNTLITYGTQLDLQEVDPTGTDVLWQLDASSAYGLYRAYRLSSLYPP